jgi:hypothetical protein
VFLSEALTAGKYSARRGKLPVPNSSGRLFAFKIVQALVMRFRDSHELTNIFGIRGDGFPDDFHFGIVAFESFIVVLLTGRELLVALTHLLLKLPLA